MTPENAKLLLGYMQDAGRDLEGRLPISKHHPRGRNPFAHVATCVKRKFGSSYKDIDDSLLENVIEYIDHGVIRFNRRHEIYYRNLQASTT